MQVSAKMAQPGREGVAARTDFAGDQAKKPGEHERYHEQRPR